MSRNRVRGSQRILCSMRPVIVFSFADRGGDFLPRVDFFSAATGELVYLRSATRRGFLRLPSLIYLPARCLVYGCHTRFPKRCGGP